ncbi:MAG: hypothetical protein LBI36_01680 [Oscillospiraceae bacterium]|jgi:hypothetical protein|nr:hypothetical protein [Oscillospiraceae bacterium]
MIDNLELIFHQADELVAALTEYKEATARLCEINLEQENVIEIGEIENIISEREKIIPKAAKAHINLMALIDEQNDDGRETLHRMFAAEKAVESVNAFAPDETRVKDKIYELLSVHGDIMEKDNEFKKRLSGKYDEVKEILRTSQEDRRKLDFFNSTSLLGRDKGFKV